MEEDTHYHTPAYPAVGHVGSMEHNENSTACLQ